MLPPVIPCNLLFLKKRGLFSVLKDEFVAVFLIFFIVNQVDKGISRFRTYQA